MTSTAQPFRFRLVVRGTTSKGQRVRRVRTIDAHNYEDAWIVFGEEHAADMAHGLRDVSYSVLPPVGWRVDGTVSRGFEVV